MPNKHKLYICVCIGWMIWSYDTKHCKGDKEGYPIDMVRIRWTGPMLNQPTFGKLERRLNHKKIHQIRNKQNTSILPKIRYITPCPLHSFPKSSMILEQNRIQWYFQRPLSFQHRWTTSIKKRALTQGTLIYSPYLPLSFHHRTRIRKQAMR